MAFGSDDYGPLCAWGLATERSGFGTRRCSEHLVLPNASKSDCIGQRKRSTSLRPHVDSRGSTTWKAQMLSIGSLVFVVILSSLTPSLSHGFIGLSLCHSLLYRPIPPWNPMRLMRSEMMHRFPTSSCNPTGSFAILGRIVETPFFPNSWRCCSEASLVNVFGIAFVQIREQRFAWLVPLVHQLAQRCGELRAVGEVLWQPCFARGTVIAMSRCLPVYLLGLVSRDTFCTMSLV